jgi:signal transduction histidine kinase
MRRLRLSTLLIGVNVGLLLLAVAGVAIFAVRLLEQLADDQALARVTQAGSSAQKSIAQAGAEVASDAQLLRERPTLRRLIESNDRGSLAAFLAQFQQTSQLDATAVLRGGAPIAQSGASLPWAVLWNEREQVNGYFIRPQNEGRPLILGAWAAVPSNPDTAVTTIVLLDEAFAQRVSSEVGLPVSLHERRAAIGNGSLVGLASHVATTGQAASARRDDLAAYVAVFPVQSPGGDLAGFVVTTLPTTAVTDSLRRLIETLIGLTLVVAAIAAIANLLLGRWLARPLNVLTAASARIGRGDLATPITARYSGEMGALTATLEDMRRRLLQTTTDLRRQQAESSAIVASITESVFSVDRERRIRFANPQFAALLGIRADDAVGRFCGDVLNPQASDGARPCEEHCPIVHARFRSGAHATEHLLLRNGQRRIVVIASAPPSEDQQVQVMRDETEVEAARRLRDAVLANISHEFKTPLSAQLASIELLLDQLPDLSAEQIAELVVRLQRGALRLAQLVDNLLESVRIEAGEVSIRRGRVSIDEVIEQALELTRPLIEQREQNVSLELPYPLPSIMGDAPRLAQVFANLLANANKFSPAGSTIRIGGAVQPETITVWVEDEGPGLPELAGRSLFERFVRSNVAEPEQGGVGLGLWITQSIVERHGGRVDAVSGASGTHLRVTLPRMSTDEHRINGY